jgi:AAA family ATP:ADP antiporter
MSKDEFKKFGILSVTLMVILGNYWILRVMKNAIFGKFVDFQMYQPWAKVSSLVVIAVLVLVYSKLVDLFSKDKLFYILCTFFGLWIIGLGYFIAHPHLVAVSKGSFLYPFVSWIPGRAIGWISYVSLEAVSFIIILFWAFVASVTKTESAKKGYGLILFVTQIGTIAGSAFVAKYAGIGAGKLSLSTIVMMSGSIILTVSLLVKLYMTVVPREEVAEKAADKKKSGFLEGLKLLITRPYVMGIFVVATMYEVIGTVLEFQMNSLGKMIYPLAEDFAAFNAKYGMGINGLALVFALIGTSFFMRKFGLRFCLVAYPSVIAVIICSVLAFNYVGANNHQLMWALFAGMIGIKGLNYALNNPTKEIMYIPTSKDVKFKAKGWIDLFGNRSTKAGVLE